VRSRAVPATIAALGLVYVVLGAWAGIDSGSFTRALADFGPANDHLVHDFGAASFAIGLGLLLAVRRPTWRTPVLAVATVWNGLHAVSHLVDIDDAESRAVGIVEAVLLVAGTGLLGMLAVASREDG
jgi:uncharacterized protein YjeT (DUF2065 family)